MSREDLKKEIYENKTSEKNKTPFFLPYAKKDTTNASLPAACEFRTLLAFWNALPSSPRGIAIASIERVKNYDIWQS